MIQAAGICKRFGRIEVLHDVSLDLGDGECVGLIGPNGCGKTTFIKAILGMVLPDQGEILFEGKSIARQVAYREHVGYMPQIGRYPDNMRVGQVIETLQRLRPGAKTIDEDLYRAYRISDIVDKRMSTLSGGTRQKVSATLAFMFAPKVLILDEPTAGLDPLSAEILKEKVVEERQRGRLILITSHLLSELDEMASEVVFMQEGKVRLHQKIGDLKANTGEATLARAIAHILKQQQQATI